ncbi:MAG: heavy-metal-associated domain-containing protein [Kofleriaceae bacterium]
MRILVALLVLASCSHDRDVPAPAPIVVTPVVARPVAPAKPAQLSHVTIKALGMYCEESCPMRVRYALADLKQVYELGFDPANESIFVSYDAALGAPKEVTKPMLVAIKNAGFDPWLAKESWPADAKTQVVAR